VETAELTQCAAACKALIESIPSQRIVDVISRGESDVLQSGGTTRPGATNDGIVEFFAHGCIREQHVAYIAAAGFMHPWSEPETGREAHVALSPAMQTRSKAILEEVESHFGVAVTPNETTRFADGGVTGFVGGVDVTGM